MLKCFNSNYFHLSCAEYVSILNPYWVDKKSLELKVKIVMKRSSLDLFNLLSCQIGMLVLFLLTLLGKAMGIAERRLREKEELKSKIICTAWDLVRTEGWSALSIRKIADKIDYSVPVIYDHFKNKEAILLEFSKKGFRLLTEMILNIIKKEDEPENKIRAVADAYWNFASENKELYQIMFSIGTMGCDITEALPEREKFRSLTADVIEELILKNGRTDVSACLKYHTLFSVMHGLISIKLVNTCTTIDLELNKMVLDDAIEGYIRSFEAKKG